MLKYLIVFATAFAMVHAAIAQKNELSMLNDRFFFTFPDSAKNMARSHNIMAADPNINTETRVVCDVGNKRMVFFAEELFVKAGSNLQHQLAAQSTKEYPLTVKQLLSRDSIAVYAVIPSVFDNKREAILTSWLIIVNADNTVSRLSVYLNPAAYVDKAKFDKITEQVFASFRKGERRLQLQPHQETFFVLGTKTQMQLDVPADHVVTVDKQYDFEVYKLTRLSNYGDEGFGELVIYYGFHPSFFSSQMEILDSKKDDTEGEFMFQKIKWLNFKDDKRNLLVREQMFVDDDITKDANIHIAMVSNEKAVIEQMTAIVKKILLKYDK